MGGKKKRKRCRKLYDLISSNNAPESNESKEERDENNGPNGNGDGKGVYAHPQQLVLFNQLN